MLQGFGNFFNFRCSNQDAPSATPGTSITPGNNSFSSYAEILSDTVVTQDLYGLFINLSSLGTAGNARDTLVNIGSDPAGGTSFSTIVPNLLGSCANPNIGQCYYFPLFIKSGTSLAAQASQNNGSPAAIRVHVIGYGSPSNMKAMKVGSFVRSFGEVTASSKGTTITLGTSGAEGSYTQLGSATAEDLWWWQVGYGANDNTMTAQGIHLDVAAGDVTNKDLLIENELIRVSVNEEVIKVLQGDAGRYFRKVKQGENIYGRGSTSVGTADSVQSMIAYGLGG